jgi:glyoxylase-like metal-dependent hydrolase (beta-lactamase superfamily II)
MSLAGHASLEEAKKPRGQEPRRERVFSNVLSSRRIRTRCRAVPDKEWCPGCPIRPRASTDFCHILDTMREILPGILMWGSTYADRPWDLNGYAITLSGCTVLVDPPAPEEGDWPKFDALKQISKIVLTNRDHVRDTKLFGTRYGARLVAGTDEVTQFAPLAIDEAVREGDLLAGALRVIHLPGKSPGEIGLYLDPAHHAISRELGGILLLGDAIIGHPPGALGLIPEHKLDNPAKLKQSLQKVLDYDFDVLLLCDGQPVLRGGKLKVAEFLNT